MTHHPPDKRDAPAHEGEDAADALLTNAPARSSVPRNELAIYGRQHLPDGGTVLITVGLPTPLIYRSYAVAHHSRI